MSLTSDQVKRKVAIGTVWMVLLKLAVRGLGILSTLILARLLLPEDYGIVAMAMAFYGLIEMLAAFGFDFMLVQKANITKTDYDSAFTAKLICYCLLAVIIFLSVDAVAAFYREPLLINILYALSLQMLLSGMENIALVDFRREMMFDKEFKFQVSVKVIGFVVTVALAYYLRNYWALVIGSISTRVANIVFGYSIRPYRPKICFEKTKEIMHFSKWLLLMNFASYFRNQLPNIVLGRNLSARSVGLFSMGIEIGHTSSQEIVAAMNRPVYSGFSKLAHDLGELRNNYLEIVSFQSMFVLATGFGVGAISELLVAVALGPNWRDLGEPLALISVGCAIASISSCSIYIFMVVNKPRYCFILSMAGLLIFAPQVFLLIDSFGLMGVVYAHASTSVISTMCTFGLAASLLSISLLRLTSVLYRPLIAALAMFVALRFFLVPIISESINNIYFSLIVSILVGGAIYSTVVFILWVAKGKPNSVEKIIVSWVQARFAKL